MNDLFCDDMIAPSVARKGRVYRHAGPGRKRSPVIEETLRQLGVTDPNEIDILAIAWCLGARVKFRPLYCCEARITGIGDRAIITVNKRSSWRRQRYSIAHELGHWKYHRGRILICRADEISRPGQDYPIAERHADSFAAQLLLPSYIFDPVARAHAKHTFQTVSAIADLFEVSITATAIRLVERGHFLAILVCHGPRGRKWFTRSPDVPDRWFPRDNLDANSFAFDVLFGKRPNDPMPRKIGAAAWFEHRDAERFEVQEQTFRTGDREILTLISIRDGAMLDEHNTQRATLIRSR